MTKYQPTTTIKEALDDVNKAITSKHNTLATKIADIRDIWNNCQSTNENWNVLQSVASKYNNPSDPLHIQTNLYIINRLYNARAEYDTLNDISNIIASQNIQFNNKQEAINKYEIIISKCSANKIKRPFVLLSKYYAVMNPIDFPIKDSLAIKSLNHFLKQKPSLTYKTSYSKYIKAIDDFISKNKLTLDYRELDKFLWLYGMTL